LFLPAALPKLHIAQLQYILDTQVLDTLKLPVRCAYSSTDMQPLIRSDLLQQFYDKHISAMLEVIAIPDKAAIGDALSQFGAYNLSPARKAREA
jgi:hypothetical protein